MSPFFFVLCILLSLSGCTKINIPSAFTSTTPEQKPTSDEQQPTQTTYFTDIVQQENDHISVTVQQLSAQDSLNYFYADYIELGYQPLLITINNHSDDLLLLRGSAIQLPLLDRAVVTHAAHRDTFLWTSLGAYTAFLYFWPALGPVAIAGSYSAWRNHNITQQVNALGVEYDDAFEILPYERVERAVFVRAYHMPTRFFLYLYNVNKKSFVPFHISFMYN